MLYVSVTAVYLYLNVFVLYNIYSIILVIQYTGIAIKKSLLSLFWSSAFIVQLSHFSNNRCKNSCCGGGTVSLIPASPSIPVPGPCEWCNARQEDLFYLLAKPRYLSTNILSALKYAYPV